MPITTNEQWQARKHETVTKRSRKGVTSQRVTRFGSAAIVGSFDRDVNGLPLLAESDTHEIEPASAAARVLLAELERGTIKRHAAGWSAIDIGKLTDAILASDPEWVATQGASEVRQWSQMVSTDQLAVTAPTALQSCGISGSYRDADWDWFAAHTAAYGAHTAIAKHAPRQRLTFKRRASDPTGVTVFGHRHIITPRTGRARYVKWCSVTTLPAPADDTETLYIGHHLVTRVPAIKRDGATTKARTIGHLPMPETQHALEVLIESLAPGERIEIGDHIVATRNPKGRYNATDKREGEAIYHRGVRTSTALALKLSA